ncbi:MAG: PIN domain-containing protein [Deferrisomatales bacterium]
MSEPRVLDTNVILRYLLADQPEQFERAKAFLDRVKVGDEEAYVSEGVLVECVYVLLKVYGVPRGEVADSLSAVLGYRGIVNGDRTPQMEALRRFAEANVDIVDALVDATARARGWTVFSFDRDLVRLARKTPPAAGGSGPGPEDG